MKKSYLILIINTLLFSQLLFSQSIQSSIIDFTEIKVNDKNVFTHKFVKEQSYVVLPIDKLSAIIKSLEHKDDLVHFSLKGYNASGDVVYPILLNHGMQVAKHKQGLFKLDLMTSDGCVFVFKEPIKSVEGSVDKGNFENIHLDFGEISSVIAAPKSGLKPVCSIKHIAIVLDDSKSTEENFEKMSALVENFIENTNLNAISFVSLNQVGTHVTSFLDTDTWEKNLQTFKQLDQSKYTDWSAGFKNLKIVNTLNEIDYILFITDGFSNTANKKSIALIQGFEEINENLSRYSNINTELVYISQEPKKGTEELLHHMLSFDYITVDGNVIEDFSLTERVKNCEDLEVLYNLFLSPNPTNSKFTINGLQEIDFNQLEVVLLDSKGSIAKKVILNDKSQNLIDISNLSNGIYFVEMTFNNGYTSTHRIVKIN